MQRIYLDHNATTPPAPEALADLVACQTEAFGNPSSLHWAGQEARLRLDRARQQVATLLGAHPEEIVFTSGATEADNLVLQGLAAAHPGGHLVTTAIEHQGVLATCRHLERHGVGVTYVLPGADGVVRPEAVAAALRPGVVLVSVMLANNDTGVLQPVREIAALAKARGIAVHTDATQALGKIPVDVRDLGVDYLTLAAHKLRGPKGAGALFCRDGQAPPPQILGGGQESGHRAGTENLPAIVGFGRACVLARDTLAAEAARLTVLRDRLERGLRTRFPDVCLNGHPELRLPNTLNVSFPGVAALPLVLNLDLLGIAVSAGSACSSGSAEPSHVLLAMGQSPEAARGGVRFSLGAATTAADIDATLAALAQILPRLQPGRATAVQPPSP